MVVFGRAYHERVSLGVQTASRRRSRCCLRRFRERASVRAKDRAARTKQRRRRRFVVSGVEKTELPPFSARRAARTRFVQSNERLVRRSIVAAITAEVDKKDPTGRLVAISKDISRENRVRDGTRLALRHAHGRGIRESDLGLTAHALPRLSTARLIRRRPFPSDK